MTQDTKTNGGSTILNKEEGENLRRVLNQSSLCLTLCRDMLDPEKLAFSVTKEVRNRVKDIFGLEHE